MARSRLSTWRSRALVNLVLGGQKFQVEEVGREGTNRKVVVDGKPVEVEILRVLGRSPVDLLVRSGGRTLHITVGGRDEKDFYSVGLNGRLLPASIELFEEVQAARGKGLAQEGPVTVSAPMAGRIASLKTSVGSVADEGQALVVLEAMKMENEVASPKKGLVKEIYVSPGALVKAGDKLVLVE